MKLLARLFAKLEKSYKMQNVQADLRFQCPLGCMVVGPSMSGKSHFILELLRRRNEFFTPAPKRMVYVYGIWQEAFKNIKDVEFVRGVDGLSGMDFNSKQPSNLVIDDLMEELSSNKEISILFTREMHHKKLLSSFWFKTYISRVKA